MFVCCWLNDLKTDENECYEDMIDDRSNIRNLRRCDIKAGKKFRLGRVSNP